MVLWISGIWVLRWASLMGWADGQASGYQVVWRVAAVWVLVSGYWVLGIIEYGQRDSGCVIVGTSR